MSTIETTSVITVKVNRVVGGDRWIVASAKTSSDGVISVNDDGSLVDEYSEVNFKFIDYLMKHRHGSPFEEGYLSLSVHAPAFVWWQWVRHRIQSYSLESARYHELRPLFYVPGRERLMMKGPDWKAARPQFVRADDDAYDNLFDSFILAYKAAWSSYKTMIEDGVASELARSVLGFGIYYTGWVRMNPRSCMHFLSLRVFDKDAKYPSFAQAEIDQAARQVEVIFADNWPQTYRSFVKNGRVSP